MREFRIWNVLSIFLVKSFIFLPTLYYLCFILYYFVSSYIVDIKNCHNKKVREYKTMTRSRVPLCVLSLIFGSQVLLCVIKLGNVVMCRPASALEWPGCDNEREWIWYLVVLKGVLEWLGNWGWVEIRYTSIVKGGHQVSLTEITI